MIRHSRLSAIHRYIACALMLIFCFGSVASALTTDELKYLLEEYYLDDVSQEAKNETTIEGVLEKIGDKYTRYYTAQEYKEMRKLITDEHVGGIGVRSSRVEEGMYVLEVFADGPAEKSGITAGDTIIAVGKDSLQGKTLEEMQAMIVGEIGTKVQFTVMKEDGSKAQYTVQREEIVIASTQSEMFDNDVAYIYCSAFTDETNLHFKEAISKHEAKADAWMIDLRDNSGGSAYTALESVGMFLSGTDNVVAYFENQNDEYIPCSASTVGDGQMEPVLVLTSAYSASASELFAAVVRDQRTGIVIGDRTFGKGIAQVVLDKDIYPEYFADGDALQITAYRYFTKRGNISHQIGVIPHVMVHPVVAPDVAYLLSADEGSNTLSVELGTWIWHIDLDLASSKEELPHFIALLEALPPQAKLKQRKTGSDWADVTVQELVEQYQIKEFASRWFADLEHCGYGRKINALATYDILKGYEGGIFKPNNTLTRAELCAMLVQAFRLTDTKQGMHFSDVDKKAWYADEVAIISAWGLMNGVADGKFDPDGLVTSEQAITVMARAGVLFNILLKEAGNQWIRADHPELERFSDWSQKWVWLLGESQTDYLGRTENLLFDAYYHIDPDEPILRAEVAGMLYNFLTHVNILPL